MSSDESSQQVDQDEATEASGFRWSEDEPPTPVELGKIYAGAALLWLPIALFLTGTLVEALQIATIPFEIVVKATAESFSMFASETAAEQTTTPQEPASKDDLSPGGFLVVGLVQIALSLLVLAAGLAITVAVAVGVLLYFTFLGGLTIRAITASWSFLTDSRGVSS